ncbi:hypothetical protein PR048_021251 [Dryococelus australis]|uniref:Uncharacterized protein n=1 Tax=Dryococelus australis TaxID=614101 RepID=A0ABQ9GXN2_9NEOP|nr:hypothetical protein PR048_021251 [Dryococelus australis]
MLRKYQRQPGSRRYGDYSKDKINLCLEAELAFASRVDKFCEYGLPVDEQDLRYVVKIYVTSDGKAITVFQINLTASNWMKSFLQRHPQLSFRFASNIKRIRAAVLKRS